MEQLILEKTLRINEVISKLLYKTEALAALVKQGNGIVDNFDKIASSIIIDSPAILNVLLAPDGVVTEVYPLTGNEAVVGLDFFSEGAGNKEAVAARNLGRLVLGGPFNLIQGGQALVGRLPVYIDTQTQTHQFWGLVSVTLKFPQVLNEAELGIINNQGFAYELWRISPDTNERQVIASNYDYKKSGVSFIEKYVPILDAEWYLKVWYTHMWYSYPENIALIIAGFLISFLVSFVMQNNFQLKQMRSVLEAIAKTDLLTGIYNRYHFMEISQINIERARRQNTDCYIVFFDIDRFKDVNDTYGHTIGDKTLIEITSRIKALIRSYDIFARYGGEEFIIFASEIDKKNILEMVERLRLSICNKMFEYGTVRFASAASFGIARISDYNIEKAILCADKALYKAKETGRNKVILYDENDSL
jgi:diguanylate cyclase (GGDEF)-like protein